MFLLQVLRDLNLKNGSIRFFVYFCLFQIFDGFYFETSAPETQPKFNVF